MKIDKVLLTPGLGSFFYDDQAAVQKGTPKNGEWYDGEPLTLGFNQIRLPASILEIGLVLEDGYIAWGDMMSVQYAGAAGRDPVFNLDRYQKQIKQHLIPLLYGRSIDLFSINACEMCQVQPDQDHLHTAIQYGLTQALLQATAYANKCTMAQVLCTEYGLPLIPKPVPLYAQSGDQRYENVDKFILKQIDVLPHGLINNRKKFGASGEKFLEYVDWVVKRIRELGDADYSPRLHFDIYGMAGKALGLSIENICAYLKKIEKTAQPFEINIESPADFGTRASQIEGLEAIRQRLFEMGCNVKIVADEWCNTLEDIQAFTQHKAVDMIQIKMPDMGGIQYCIEAVKLCHANNIAAFLGGSCTETDISARASVHVAIATQADMLLCKPGMGADEGISITKNEQVRLLAELSCAYL